MTLDFVAKPSAAVPRELMNVRMETPTIGTADGAVQWSLSWDA